MHWCRIKFIFNHRSTNLNSSPTVKGMTTYRPSKQIKKNQKQLASVPLFINQVDMLDIESYSFGNHQIENPPLLTKRLSIQCFHLVWHTSMKFTAITCFIFYWIYILSIKNFYLVLNFYLNINLMRHQCMNIKIKIIICFFVFYLM